jgi:hypothetical protein
MCVAKRLGLFVLLSLALPACGSKKTVVTPHDGSTPLDLGRDADQDAGVEVIPDAAATEATRDRAGDALRVGSDGPDAAGDTPVTRDGPVAEDLKSQDEGSEETGVACVAGAACSGQTSCSSGDEIDLWCRTMLVCQSGILRAPARFPVRCGASAGSPCPAIQPGEGEACPLLAQTCSYTTGTCACATGCESGVDAGPCQRPKTWYCNPRPANGCPTQAPQLGDPCSGENMVCFYGRYCYQYEVTCQGGHWEPHGWAAFGGCN